MLGVWMWPESIERRGADAVFGACRRAGVTDVFFLTKGLSGVPVFPSRVSAGRDLLREALDAAHGRGMRLHAWFTSASDARYKRAHPEAGLCHFRDGRNRDIVSISDQNYLRFMQELMADMLRRYEVDGVHLDYIRYNHLVYGWSEEDQRRYEARGVNLPRVRALMEKTFCGDSPDGAAIFDAYRQGEEAALRLAAARRRDVNDFAQALCGSIRAERPSVTISAALMPEGAYDDLAFADLHYGQNYADLAHWVDLFLPMAYSQAYGQDAAWVGRVTRGAARCGKRTVTGVHAYEGGTARTLQEDLAAVRAEPAAEGACLFREGAAVWAYVGDRHMALLNPLDAPVTACRLEGPEGCAVIPTSVASGEQKAFDLPFRPGLIQALSGEKELCTYYIGED